MSSVVYFYSCDIHRKGINDPVSNAQGFHYSSFVLDSYEKVMQVMEGITKASLARYIEILSDHPTQALVDDVYANCAIRLRVFNRL
jgi:hypothetical protein